MFLLVLYVLLFSTGWWTLLVEGYWKTDLRAEETIGFQFDRSKLLEMEEALLDAICPNEKLGTRMEEDF